MCGYQKLRTSWFWWARSMVYLGIECFQWLIHFPWRLRHPIPISHIYSEKYCIFSKINLAYFRTFITVDNSSAHGTPIYENAVIAAFCRVYKALCVWERFCICNISGICVTKHLIENIDAVEEWWMFFKISAAFVLKLGKFAKANWCFGKTTKYFVFIFSYFWKKVLKNC